MTKKKASKRAATRTRKHGGKRAGAGRPRDKLPDDVIARLGAPPATPTELRTWNAKLLAEVQWLAIRGEIRPELAASIRANAGALDRALPAERRDDGGGAGAGDDDEIDDNAAGPALTAADDESEGLRVG